MTRPHAGITAEEILKTGLLNQWYLVCRSVDLKDRPLGITRLGRDVVLWRDDAGKVWAVEDICPHRRAPLSKGRVMPEGLACSYHGLTVDGGGVVVAVPPVEHCPLVGRKMVDAFPAREAAGAIWLYFSDGLSSELPELDLPEQLTGQEWSSFIYAEEWSCHFQLPLDNRLDPMHAIYLHDDSFTLSKGVKQSKIEIYDTEWGFFIQRDNQRGVNIDRTEVVHKRGNNYWVFTSIPYPKAAGGNFFTIASHPTPIDEHRTYVWVMRCQKSEGWRRDLWRFLYRNRLEARHDEVIHEDKDIMEAIPAAPWLPETLIQCDVGVSRIRRMLAKEANEQARRIREHFAARAAE
jgi:phenylpropionate dioxygenase-like ring-hydroxylating dioxygenase large terminal subunit